MRRRGSLLFTALAIAAVMMLWAVAAVQQVNFQTRATRHAYRKSELYYLCKQAASRAMDRINRDPSWLATFTSSASADTSTPDTRCWAEPIVGKPQSYNLRCQAQIGDSQDTLTVPLVADSDSSTQVYSLTPSANGADLVAWTSRTKDGWGSLPPIPGISKIESVVGTSDGDIYSIGKSESGTSLWRYRRGRGWVRLPDAPGGVQLRSLAANSDQQLICLGSDNSLLIFPLKVNAMQWDAVSAPSGVNLKEVACSQGSTTRTYVSAQTSGGPKLMAYDQTDSTWVNYPTPPAVRIDEATGQASPLGQPAADLSGGIAVAASGKIFAASNPGDSPSVIYAFQPDSAGSTTGNWTALPPVLGFTWSGVQAQSTSDYATNLQHLRVDDQGGLWAQLTSPDGRAFGNIHVTSP
ncbi:MAG: hypothetical protein U0931_34650 [Vulcanimicrobiota bacterium]